MSASAAIDKLQAGRKIPSCATSEDLLLDARFDLYRALLKTNLTIDFIKEKPYNIDER